MANALTLSYPELDCWDDVDSFGRTLPSDLAALVQDVYHVLIEEFGTNIDDPDRGIGINALLSGPVSGLTTAQNKIDQELPKSLAGRVDTNSTTIVQNPDGSYTMALNVGVDGKVLGMNFAFAGGALSLVSTSGPS